MWITIMESVLKSRISFIGRVKHLYKHLFNQYRYQLAAL